MATARIQRNVLDQGGLPAVCICCGNPAEHGIRHWFRPQPTWWLFASPLVIVLLIALAVGLWALGVPRFVSKLLTLAIFAVLIPVGGAIDLAVPVCSFHRFRLRYHEFYLLLVVLLLCGVAVATVLAMVNQRPDLNELILRCAVFGAPVLMALSIGLRFITPRVINSEYAHIDMTMLAPGFVQAITQPGKSRLGFPLNPLGQPLRGDWTAVPRWVYVTGGVTSGLLIALVVGCMGLGTLMRWKHERDAREFHARARAGMLFTPPPGAPPRPPTAPARVPPGFRSLPEGISIPAPPPPAGGSAEPRGDAVALAGPALPVGSRFGPRGGIGMPAPGYEVTSDDEIQINEPLHVQTENGWRPGHAVETASGQVRVRLIGRPSNSADWFAIDQVRFMRRPEMRSRRRKPDAVTSAPAPPPPASTPPVAPPPPPAAASSSAASPPPPPAASPSAAPVAKAGTLRTWSDVSGKFQIEAELVKVEDGNAVLQKADGSLVRIALDKLSLADRLYAQAQSP